jgi:hypothetical protein
MRRAAEAEASTLGAGIDSLAVAQKPEELGRPGRGEVLVRRRGHPASAAHRIHPHDTTRGGEGTRAREAQERHHEACGVAARGRGVTHLES